jgi:hypothetical protein
MVWRENSSLAFIARLRSDTIDSRRFLDRYLVEEFGLKAKTISIELYSLKAASSRPQKALWNAQSSVNRTRQHAEHSLTERV